MDAFSVAISVIETICGALFAYQMVYIIIALIKKTPVFQAKAYHNYAILIAARNEEQVIGNLVKSILAQDYPKELVHVFVVADNCTDHTAAVASAAGAKVYERFNDKQQGKGYALQYILNRIDQDYGYDAFDGYMIFDADNLLAPDYITEINKVFSNGFKICTSYRNSKNYGVNWVTAGLGIWFLREARHLNHARMLLKVSCMVSGTGYVVHKDIIKANGGWKFFLMTEDVEFSVDSILKGERIGYCESAVFYDEQPTTLKASLYQRLRWVKGFYQVLYKNFGGLVRGLFSKNGFTCFDSLVTLAPGHIFLAACISIVTLVILRSIFVPGDSFMLGFITMLLPVAIGGYAMFWLFGFLVLLTERKKIYCRFSRAFLLLFLFPIVMVTIVPVAIAALFMKVSWKPIKHEFAVDNEQMIQQGK